MIRMSGEVFRESFFYEATLSSRGRLLTFWYSVVKLVQNYRSHPKILEFPNQEFYKGDLRACADRSKTHRVVGRWSGLVSDKFPIVFHSVRGKDCRDKHSPSYFNADEILVVKEHLTSLLNEPSLNLRKSVT